MRRILFTLFSFSIFVFFTSCRPEISVKVFSNDSAIISFATGFSDATAKTLRSISGLSDDSQIFSPEDIVLVLKETGVQNPVAKIATATSIESAGVIPAVKTSVLQKTGILSTSGKSLKLTLGPKQIEEIYNRLNDDSKAYFDMMMIPALLGEKMTVKEYRELLASMYGPTFADELVNGTLVVYLESPDSKKTTKASVSLGELLTMTSEKSWTVSW